MKIKSKVIHEFKGDINGVTIKYRNHFYTIEHILYTLQDNGIRFNEEFIKELARSLEHIEFNSFNEVIWGDLERDLYLSIENGTLLESYLDHNESLLKCNEILKELNKGAI